MRELMLFLHLVGVVVWVGGMFFAHYCLRPAALQLPPPQRLPLMAAALDRFFAFVALALALLWVSGLAMIAQLGFATAPWTWHAMMTVALLMTVIFGVIRLMRHPRLRACVDRGDWPAAAAALNGIRALVVVNLALGMLTLAIATLGRLI